MIWNLWSLTAGYLFIFLLMLVQMGCSNSTVPQKEILYVGTFADEGIFVLEFDRSERSFTEIQRVDNQPEPNFQALHPEGTYLYSISRAGEFGSIAAYSIDPESGNLTFINEQLEETRGQNHISIDPGSQFAYVSNGGQGNLSVYPIFDDGRIGEAVDLVQHEGSSAHPRQGSAYMHSNTPSNDGRFIYASDLGIDKVMIYTVDRLSGQLSPAQTHFAEVDPGSGPRHYVIHPYRNFAYSLNELSSTITAFTIDTSTGALVQIHTIEMLPEDFDGNNISADIHISPDGRFLYGTNRGHDSLVIYEIDTSTGRLELRGHESTRGGHPRNFAMDQLGEFIFMTNQDDNNLVLFERDTETGLLTYTGVEVEIPRPVCVTQLILN